MIEFASIKLLLSTLFLVTLCISTPRVSADVTSYQPKDKQLYETIAHMDALVFDAFNRHDANALMKFFSEDVEFYDDGDGVADYKGTLASFKAMFGSGNNSNLRRELVKDSLEVYPLKDYGAIEAGLHRFIHTENGKEEIGVTKFTMVWRQRDGEWKLTRVISYNHDTR